MNTKRTAWKFLLDIRPGQSALVLELGDGAAAFSLAQHVAVARCEITATFLPFPHSDAQFDFVVIEDVDRIAMTATHVESLLHETFRVLKPDGHLFVSAANKHDVRYMLRGKSGTVRRWSRATLRAALRRANFSAGTAWVLTPSLENVHYLWPWGEPYAQSGPDSPTRREALFRRLTATSLAPLVVPAFALVACKAARPAIPFGERVVGSAVGATQMEVLRFQVGNPSTAIYKVRTGAGDKIVRLPMDNESLQRCGLNWQALTALGTQGCALAGKIPQAVATGEIESQTYFCEGAIAGVTVDSAAFPLNRIMAQAASLLTRFQRQTMECVDVSGELLSERCTVFKDLSAAGIDSAALLAIEQFICAQMSGRQMPLVYLHGDYKIENMVLDADSFTINGIIDWDLSHPQGLPLVDLLYLITYAEITRSGRNFYEVYRSKTLAGEWREDERVLIAEYLQAIPIASDLILPITILFLLEHIAYRLNAVLAYVGGEWRGDIDATLAAVVDKIASVTVRTPVSGIAHG